MTQTPTDKVRAALERACIWDVEGAEYYRDALRELDGAVLVRGWQPIETAPKDGTRVLIVGGRYDHEATGGEFTADISEPVVATWEADLYKGVWRIENDNGFLEVSKNPEMWMPMIAPYVKGE